VVHSVPETGGARQHDFTYLVCIFNRDLFLISAPLSSCCCQSGKIQARQRYSIGVISVLRGFRSLPVLLEKGKKASIPSRFLLALKFFLPSRGRLLGGYRSVLLMLMENIQHLL